MCGRWGVCSVVPRSRRASSPGVSAAVITALISASPVVFLTARMPKAAALPPRPVSPSPHWVARSPFSVAELADGFGAGWPPPTRLRVPARRRDLLSRRAEFARLRALRRRKYKGTPPRGAKQDDTARALDAAQSLTTTCPCCRGLIDVCLLRRRLKKQAGPSVGCAGPGCTRAKACFSPKTKVDRKIRGRGVVSKTRELG